MEGEFPPPLEGGLNLAKGRVCGCGNFLIV